MKRSFALLRTIGRRQKPAQSRWQTTNSTQQHFVSSVRPSTYPTNVQGTRPNGKEINKALSDKASPMRNKVAKALFLKSVLTSRLELSNSCLPIWNFAHGYPTKYTQFSSKHQLSYPPRCQERLQMVNSPPFPLKNPSRRNSSKTRGRTDHDI